MVLHKTFDPLTIFKDIENHKATIFDGVPTMYMFMLNSPEFKKANLSSLSRCYVGGQTMPIATMKSVENPDKNLPIRGTASSSLVHDMTLTVDQTNSSFTQAFSSEL